MSGSTIDNWGKFDKNVFNGISGLGGKDVAKLQRSENEGVLASRVAEVFREVAKDIKGMSLTFECKLAGIMKDRYGYYLAETNQTETSHEAFHHPLLRRAALRIAFRNFARSGARCDRRRRD